MKLSVEETREYPIAEQPQGQHRFGGATLDDDECDQRRDCEHTETDDLRRSPVVGRTAEIGEKHDRAQSDRQESGAGVVNRSSDTNRRCRQGHGQHGQRDEPEWDVDPEDPSPGEMRGEITAEQRSGDAGDAEDGAKDALVPAAFARRHDVADDGLTQDRESAAAQSLDRPKDDQSGQTLAETAERRSDQEDDDGRLEDNFATVEIAELPVERSRDCFREEVGGHDPGDVIESAEVADDRRQCRRDDCRIERGQEHDGDQAAKYDPELPTRQGERRVGCGHRASHRVPRGQPASSRAQGIVMGDGE